MAVLPVGSSGRNRRSLAWNGACQVLLLMNHVTLDEESTCCCDAQCFLCNTRHHSVWV